MFCMNVDRMFQLQGDMSDSAFARTLGVSRTQLWRIRSGKSSPGADFIAKFKMAYPNEPLEDYFFMKECSMNRTNSTEGTL